MDLLNLRERGPLLLQFEIDGTCHQSIEDFKCMEVMLAVARFLNGIQEGFRRYLGGCQIRQRGESLRKAKQAPPMVVRLISDIFKTNLGLKVSQQKDQQDIAVFISEFSALKRFRNPFKQLACGFGGRSPDVPLFQELKAKCDRLVFDRSMAVSDPIGDEIDGKFFPFMCRKMWNPSGDDLQNQPNDDRVPR